MATTPSTILVVSCPFHGLIDACHVVREIEQDETMAQKICLSGGRVIENNDNEKTIIRKTEDNNINMKEEK